MIVKNFVNFYIIFSKNIYINKLRNWKKHIYIYIYYECTDLYFILIIYINNLY